MRKIISGQSFLYRKNGYHSTIIEVIMKDRVRGDYLQMALSLSLQRFPYLIDEQEFINYAKSNNATPTILTAILFSKAILENNDIDKNTIHTIYTCLK